MRGIVAFALAVVGCGSAEVSRLGQTNGPGPGSNIPFTGGPADCGGSLRFRISPEFAVEQVEGPAAFLPTGAIRMGLLTGEQPSVRFDTGNFPSLPNFYYGRLESVAPYDEQVRLTLWTQNEEGGPDQLSFVAWSGPHFRSGEIGALKYRYETTRCVAEGPCDNLRSQRLIVNERMAVDAGSQREAEGFTALNGRSFAPVSDEACSLRQPAWFEGWIALD